MMETLDVRVPPEREMKIMLPENEGNDSRGDGSMSARGESLVSLELAVGGFTGRHESAIPEISSAMAYFGHQTEEIRVGIMDGSTNHFAANEEMRVHRVETDMEHLLLNDNSMNVNCSRYGFEPGDMVWGKVKSHPWWPGHIFNESFASNSVRRTKRAGHVLVAFFGDSSYGWFDPAELIPFDPNYAEKSHQTNSRNFMKAVEEAVDETSRRQALGLVCRCRKPFNFRPTDVNGYFVVDIDDYEPGAVYSANQIKKARDAFCPTETLSFLQELAVTPQPSEQRSMSWIKNMAKLLSYRKAVFEEFDETYAQAFGMEPVRPSRNAMGVLEQTDKIPARAPLSGPLVVAEALGERKNNLKPPKVKESSKKDKYLFKRRDVPSGQGMVQANILPSDYYILQKRDAPMIVETKVLTQAENGLGVNSLETKAILPQLNTEEVRNIPLVDADALVAGDFKANHPFAYASISSVQGSSEDGTQVPVLRDSGVGALSVSGMSSTYSVVGLSESSVTFNSFPELVEGAAKASEIAEQSVPKATVAGSMNGMVLNERTLKRPMDDPSSENSSTRKKKKKHKSDGVEVDLEHPLNCAKVVERDLIHKRAGKSIGIGSSGPHLQMDPWKEDGVNNMDFPPSGLQSIPDIGSVGLPQLVEHLLGLALDPFHGTEYNSSAIVRHVFLRFRSLVYQKSLVLPPASEPETPEKVQRESTGGSAEEQDSALASKPPKQPLRPDDPSKMGRKRGPSDRQEEMSAKRLKKLNELKALASEKKAAGLKALEGQQQKGERKEPATVATQVNPPKEKARQDAAPVRPADPTSLVMKFPPRTTLPSVSQLKARFARFGPLDHSGTRIYWKTSSCRVVFKHKFDAEAAYNYATRNNTFFGQMKVNFSIKEYEVPGEGPPPEPAESTKLLRSEDASNIPQQDFPAEPKPPLLQLVPPLLLKSCLKKPSGDEAGPSVLKESSPRVKFLLGVEDSNGRGDPTVLLSGNVSGNSRTSEASTPTASSLDVTTNSSSKSLRTAAPAVAPHFNPPPNTTRMFPDTTVATPVATMDNHGQGRAQLMSSDASGLGKEGLDISYQMLSLMMRCNDIVSNVTGTLGYAPYHPL